MFQTTRDEPFPILFDHAGLRQLSMLNSQDGITGVVTLFSFAIIGVHHPSFSDNVLWS